MQKHFWLKQNKNLQKKKNTLSISKKFLVNKWSLTYHDGMAMFIFNVTGITGLHGEEKRKSRITHQSTKPSQHHLLQIITWGSQNIECAVLNRRSA